MAAREPYSRFTAVRIHAGNLHDLAGSQYRPITYRPPGNLYGSHRRRVRTRASTVPRGLATVDRSLGWVRYPSLGVHRTASRPTRPFAVRYLRDLGPSPGLVSSAVAATIVAVVTVALFAAAVTVVPIVTVAFPAGIVGRHRSLFRRFPDAAAVTLSSLGWRVGFKDETPIGGTRARQVLDPKWLRPASP